MLPLFSVCRMAETVAKLHIFAKNTLPAMQYFLKGIKKSFDFGTRASSREFFQYYLGMTLAFTALYIPYEVFFRFHVGVPYQRDIVLYLVYFAMWVFLGLVILPSLAVTCRRLNDCKPLSEGRRLWGGIRLRFHKLHCPVLLALLVGFIVSIENVWGTAGIAAAATLLLTLPGSLCPFDGYNNYGPVPAETHEKEQIIRRAAEIYRQEGGE